RAGACVATAGGRGPRAPRVAAAGVAPGPGEAPLPPPTSRPVLRPRPRPAARGIRGSRFGPQRAECVGGHLISLGSPRARCMRRKYKSSAVPTARSNQAPGADVPAAGLRDGGSTHPIKPRSIVMRTPQSHTALENPPARSALEDLRMPVRAKLAAAWTIFMFLYIYVDYFHLHKPGVIDNLRAGVVFEYDISPTLLTIMLASVAIPALMVMLSMTL